jgi:hypothetical protein
MLLYCELLVGAAVYEKLIDRWHDVDAAHGDGLALVRIAGLQALKPALLSSLNMRTSPP